MKVRNSAETTINIHRRRNKQRIAKAIEEEMPLEANDTPILQTTLTEEKMTQKLANTMTDEISIEILENAVNEIDSNQLPAEITDEIWNEIDELLKLL
ncbi:hypothetical protein TSAR_016937 [Trichomalopsis sarcophagae]|uniref:Uncharacterized protein n=1 Tax=Trichomalopsis sarcophagae TaxID=543379 RepID=A0A232EHA2_9HYME|nr:hypothetical protein TSAR_016937 [Trichomalopsis sarcophagae]